MVFGYFHKFSQFICFILFIIYLLIFLSICSFIFLFINLCACFKSVCMYILSDSRYYSQVLFNLLIKNEWRRKYVESRNENIYIYIYIYIYIIFSSEISGPSTFWILPTLYELCKSCRRKPLETLE